MGKFYTYGRAVLFVGYLLTISSKASFGQFDNRPVYDTTTTQGIHYRIGLTGLASTNSTTPFWLRSLQFGTIPWQTPAGLATVGFSGIWGDATQNRRPYIKAGLEVVGNMNGFSQDLNRTRRIVLPEAYAAFRLGHGELYVGRRKEINGLADTLLSSGSIAWSGNAVPITQVRLGTKDFAPLGFTKGVISINAFISHGWIADSDSMQNVRLHAKSVFVRIGKPGWKFRLYGGINHFAQWGGYSPYLRGPGIRGSLSRDGYLPSSFHAFKNVLWPVNLSGERSDEFTEIDTANRVGNHLGSIDFAADIQLKQSNLYFYYQHIFEDNSGVKFWNFPDGLWGIRWKNLATTSKTNFQIKQITAEFLTTLDRSGSDPVYGNDDYFFNGQYLDGWVHRNFIIGTPVFTRTADVPKQLSDSNGWYKGGRPMKNNFTQSIHLGVYSLLFQQIQIVLLLTANNYFPAPPNRLHYQQLYTSLELNNIKLLPSSGLTAGLKIAYDAGYVFNGNLGGMITLRKVGVLKKKRM